MATDRGRELVRLYDDNVAELSDAARTRYDLVDSVQHLWTRLHPIIVEIVTVAKTGSSPNPDLRFTAEDYLAVQAMGARFQQATRADPLQRTIDVVLLELEGYVGLAGSEMLRKLRTSPSIS
jgi:hypothetical protein